MLGFALTLGAGFALGYLLYRLKVPGGMMVGSIIGAAALNIFTATAYVPPLAKSLAQVLAGAYIGTTIDRAKLARLRHIGKPAFILLSVYLLTNLVCGLLIYSISPLDLATSLFASVPGGISDIPLIAVDMGADGPKVAAMQFVRLAIGAGVFPIIISTVCKNENTTVSTLEKRVKPLAKVGSAKSGAEIASAPIVKKQAFAGKYTAIIVTIGSAVLSGSIGVLLKIPAGALVFSMAGVVALKLIKGEARLPMWLKRMAQVLSGAYIGSAVGMGDIMELGVLPLPVLLLVVIYSGVCFLDGWLLNRTCGMSRKEAMLAGTPAGASDMALISMDMGVQSADLIVLHVLRLVTVSAIFPQIIGLILHIFA